MKMYLILGTKDDEVYLVNYNKKEEENKYIIEKEDRFLDKPEQGDVVKKYMAEDSTREPIYSYVQNINKDDYLPF